MFQSAPLQTSSFSRAILIAQWERTLGEYATDKNPSPQTQQAAETLRRMLAALKSAK